MIALELGDTCVELLEESDLGDPGALRDHLKRVIMDERHRLVVLDLWRLKEITSAVVAVLVGARAEGVTCGTPVAFACARRRVMRALTSLRELFTVHGSVGTALEEIRKMGTRAWRRVASEEGQRREAAMEDERLEDGHTAGGVGSRDLDSASAEDPAVDGLGVPPCLEEEGSSEDQGPVDETEEKRPMPSRYAPEPVMESLLAGEPPLAEAPPLEVEPVEALPHRDIPMPDASSVPEALAPEVVDAVSQAVAEEATPEPVAKNKSPGKKIARKKISHKGKSRKKTAAEGHRKQRRKSATSRKKARA